MLFRGFIAIAAACELAAQSPARVDPERQLWTSVRHSLTGPDGDEYFQSSMKDAMLPRLKGTLIATLPSDGGNFLILGLTDSTTPDVALLVRGTGEKSIAEISPGMQIEFVGVPIVFTKDPFLVTFILGDRDSVVLKPLGVLAPSWYLGPPLGNFGVKLDLPSDWTAEATRPSVDGGDISILRHSQFEGAVAGVWTQRSLSKDHQVLQSFQHAESFQPAWISGRQALTAVADYEENGQKMSESLTWIVTEKTRILFFARTTAYDMPIFQTHFDQIISSAVVP
jgi:hypothetical protein